MNERTDTRFHSSQNPNKPESNRNEKKDLYRHLVERSIDAIYRMSLCDGRYEYVNSAIRDITGYTPEEFYRTPYFIRKIIHPDWEVYFEQQWKNLLAGSIPAVYEYPIVHKSGEVRWLNQRNVLIRDEQGRPAFIEGIITDITDRRSSEELIKDRLEHLTQPIDARSDFEFDDLFDLDEIQRIQDVFAAATGVASVITTPDGKPLTRPSNFCRLCSEIIRTTEKGLRNCMHSDAVLGRPNPHGPTMHPCYSGGLWDGGASLWVGDKHIANWLIGQVRNEELDQERIRNYARDIGADEHEFAAALEEVTVMTTEQFRQVCQALFIIANQLSRLAYKNIQQARAIHQRQQVEEALRESESLYSSLVENLPQCILRKDLEGRYLFVNQPFCDLLQLSKYDILGKTDSDFFPPDLAEQYRSDDRRVMETEKISESVQETQWTGGDKRQVQMVKIPLYNAEEQVVGVQGFFYDITEKSKMEQELAKIRKLESVGLLAGGIAHDFNNILTAILGNLSLIKTLLDEHHSVMPFVREAEAASVKAQKLTQQLLTFSKGGAPVRETASIEETVAETVAFILRGSNIHTTVNMAPDLWLVDVDKGQFSQVIQNLVLNAKQAMPEGGTVTVTARNVTVGGAHPSLREGRFVSVSIQDSGPGIREEYLPRIFDPYFSTKTEGSGLGLAISYSIVQKHNGTLTVESAVGQGSTFTVYLPSSDRQERFRPKESAGSKPASGKGRVLFMDDEELVRKVAGAMLQRLGYEAEFAKDGEEAVALYREALEQNRRFDAVIMDLTIPGGMGGEKAVQRLHAIDDQVTAVVSSGYSTDPIMAEHQKYGFRSVITKPYRIEDLGSVLQSLIHQSAR